MFAASSRSRGMDSFVFRSKRAHEKKQDHATLDEISCQCKDKIRPQSGAEILPGARNTQQITGSWTGDLIIADWHDIEHKRRFRRSRQNERSWNKEKQTSRHQCGPSAPTSDETLSNFSHSATTRPTTPLQRFLNEYPC